MPEFDLVAIGRAGLDLYSEQIGVPFENVRSFAAYVGGTPANVAVGARRLGLRVALSSAVSADPVGDFILHFLEKEGVETRFISRMPGRKSGLVLLGIASSEHFPRVHYRDGCADQGLSIDDVARLPLEETRALLVSGTSLTHSPGREAALFAAERARALGLNVVLDLDFRPDLWAHPEDYSTSIRELIRLSGTILGTQEEIIAAAPMGKAGASEPSIRGAILHHMQLGPGAVIEKRGAGGSRVHLTDGDPIDVPGFVVKVQNSLGAGDAFAAGLIFGRLHHWDWYRSARFGNACGAIVVERHACSASCPTYGEIEAFITERAASEP